MNKAFLMQLWIFVVGFLLSNLHRRTFDPVFRILIALPIGWAVFGIAATIIYGIHFSHASQMLLLAMLALTTLGLFLANITQASLSKDSILLAGVGVIVLTCASLFFESLRIVTLTPDSSYIARFGQNIGAGNYEASRMVFSMWGPLVPLLHSITNLLDQKLYWQYQPVLSLALIAIVFYTVYTIFRDRRSILQSSAAATVAVSLTALSNLFFFHFFYVHTIVVSALYMYLFVFALLKMQQQSGRAWEFLALLSLIAFGLARIEAPLYVAVILLIASFWQGWSYVNRLKLIVPFVVVFVAWYLRVYFILPPGADLLTKRLAIAVVAGLVAFGLFAVLSRSKVLEPIATRTPLWTLIGLGLSSVLFTLMRPEHMLTSLLSMLRNAFVHGNWGLTWYLLLFIAAELYFAGRDTRERHWLSMVVVAYILLVYDLAYFSYPYYVADYDSANRLLLVVLPTTLLYLSLRTARVNAGLPFPSD